MSIQLKRVRSPNYPALSLAAAVARLERLYERLHRHAAPKEAVVKALGYGGWNGASASALSAFLKYGLLERVGDDGFKITHRGMDIMYGSADEKHAALKAAALAPSLYEELFQAFPGITPHEDVLRPWLIRRGFAPPVVTTVIEGYRETIDIAGIAQPIAADKVDVVSTAHAPSIETASQPVGAALIALPAAVSHPKGREERITDDEGNTIIVQFPFDPTLETYEFLRDYVEFRIARLRRAANSSFERGDDQ